MSTKELIEKFYNRFAKVHLRFSFPHMEHDMLDDYYPQSKGYHEENADIHRICGEYLELLWYPNKIFYNDDEKLTEKHALLELEQFNGYYQKKQEQEKLWEGIADLEERRQSVQAFHNERCKLYPLLFNKQYNMPHKWVFALLVMIPEMEKLMAIECPKTALEAFKSFVICQGNWGDSPGPFLVETIKENKKRHKEEKRRELDKFASRIAEEAGCRVTSMKFIHVVLRKIRTVKDRRLGLREDGLCATAYPGSMRGYEQWCEMDNDYQSDASRLRQVLTWLQTHCPLLWAEYQERKLAAKKSKE